MTIQELSTGEIESLVGTRHAAGRFEYPANGLQPYYQWLVASLHLLGEASAGGFRVDRDNANGTTVAIAPGRATLDDVVLVYLGGTNDLAVFNNDTVYMWLHNNGGVASIGQGSAVTGWPTAVHLKLAEVTLLDGLITQILDRRHEAIFQEGLDGTVLGTLIGYTLNITTQGSISTLSTIEITAQDLRGTAVSGTDFLRMRVCDGGGYTNATNATIAAGANTTMVETIVAGKDLVLESHTDGTFRVDVTNGVAETITLRIGSAVLSSRRGDYSSTQDVTHS